MTIKDNLTVINQWPERYGYKVIACVIHSTWGSYNGSVSWFKNPAAKASSHYVISKDGEISLCVQESAAAWHAGVVTTTKENAPKVIKDNWGTNPNLISIGIECEDRRNKNWNYPTIQYQAVVELTADICKRNNIPISRDYIILHREIDPINRSDPVGQWNHDKFIQDVRLMAEKIMSPQPVYAWEGWVTIRPDIHSVFIRSGPARIYPQAGSKMLYPGDKVEVVEFVEGEKVAYTLDGKIVESPYWWKSKLGHYFWAGGTVEQPGLKKNDEILNLQKEVNKMTQEEKTVKLAEFEARKALLDARKLELDEAYKANDAALEAFDAEFSAFNSEPVVEVPVEPVAEVVAEPVAEVVEEVKVEEVPSEVVEPVAEESKFEEMFAAFKEWMKSRV